MRRAQAIAAACLLGIPVILGAQVISSRTQDPRLQGPVASKPPFDPEAVRKWIAAAAAHTPGQLDEVARAIAAWPVPQLTETVGDAVALAKSIPALQAKGGSGQVKFGLDYIYTVADLQRFFGLSPNGDGPQDASQVLQRGAMLHTDIAILSSAVSLGQATAVEISDGQVIATASVSVHWDLARELLDGVTPTPARVELTRQWYYASSAFQASTAHWSDAMPHLDHALHVLPGDARLLFDSGVMREAFAAPTVQLVLQEEALKQAAYVKAFGGAFLLRPQPLIETAPIELRKADKLFHDAVAAEPGLAEARLHLGRVAGLLGRHDEAARELTTAMAAITDRTLLYYASLFLGLEHQRLGKTDEARRDLERAAAIYPTAQAPLLALSQLARQAGDAPRARQAFDWLAGLPADSDERDDPWWTYDRAHARDADRQLAAARQAFAAGWVK